MLEQELTEHNIRRLIRQSDVKKYNLWSSRLDSAVMIRELSCRLLDKQYKLDFHSFKHGGKSIYSPSNPETELITRNIDFLIRRIYRIKQADRERIVRQLQSILKSQNDFEITRLDVSGFYESIRPEKLLAKLSSDAILTEETLEILRTVFRLTNPSGLPRGLSISASLSELFMRDFDRIARGGKSIIFMARYVDDIVLVSLPGAADEISEIRTALVSRGLSINTDKDRFISTKQLHNCNNFDYLGYNIKLYTVPKKRRNIERKVEISIAASKMKKIKRKFCTAIAQYLKTGNFPLLKDRIRVLTSNYNLEKSSNGILKSGIYFRYKLVSSGSSSLLLLDRFRRETLNGRSRISRALNAKLTPAESLAIQRYSFASGYAKRISVHLSEERLVQVHNCWNHA